MVDVFTKEKRSWVMSRIRSKHTKVEKLLGLEMRKAGIKFKKYPKMFGSPDFLLDGKIVIFVDGCFWHKCQIHYKEPKSRRSFWLDKIERNVERDRKVTIKLKRYGYKVVRLWEHDVEKNVGGCVQKIESVLNNQI